ncbi:helix-turn-helix domain-containing protein [Sedimentitalea sp. JM2-8]|uniref:Helix-turn-helix domain-containing protein n=1 Tax=Sedimentitalea xiamensis TaxID=3050037 RepID=A0ABT7FI09_9RHOB|nr:helix-turn-helix domain-containing protein [Sedimentitalea xiamensis]MDK3074727.1 helix-turn-helix domain-containing protein [Sedimentitalea xiamensis]
MLDACGEPLSRFVRQRPVATTPNDYLDGFIDETDAADFLCQSVRTIQKWRVTGFGPKFYKSGRSIRYRRRDLLAWGETRRRANTSQNAA